MGLLGVWFGCQVWGGLAFGVSEFGGGGGLRGAGFLVLRVQGFGFSVSELGRTGYMVQGFSGSGFRAWRGVPKL